MKNYRKWTENEWKTFLELLKTNNISQAARMHSENTGRSYTTILSRFYYIKKKGIIPSDIIDNIPCIVSERLNSWTPEQENELLKLIEEYPNNFREAYRIYAENSGRSVDAVRVYFQKYRKKEEAKTCMLTVGKKKRNSPNRKNIYPGTGGSVEHVRKSIWRRIINIIFG